MRVVLPLLVTALALSGPGLLAQWVHFADETDTRLVADPALGVDDTEEKDYAWGDVDRDGDIDLVVVRKQPYTTTTPKPNLLLVNEAGVLVDRTAEFATDSDVAGDQGFQTPTNDRDVQLVDLDLDGWLDIVTASTHSDGQPKHIGHPRIYINKGGTGRAAGAPGVCCERIERLCCSPGRKSGRSGRSSPGRGT